MTQSIPEVQNTPSIKSAEFVKITVYNDFTDPTDTTVYTKKKQLMVQFTCL